MKPKRNPSTLTRWTVQEFFNGMWQTWSDRRTHDYRFFTLERAKADYEEYKKEFHYCPVTYRYCKVEIQPEYIVDIEYRRGLHMKFT